MSIKHGNYPGSAVAFLGYGIILCCVLGDINRGNQFGKLALNLMKQFINQEFKARIIWSVYALLIHWKKHARKTVRLVSENYQIGLETGDFEYASYSASIYSTYSFFTGMELSELKGKITIYEKAILAMNQEMIIGHIKLFRQAVLNLTDQVENPYRLAGEACNEEQALSIFLKANDKWAIFNLYLHKLMLYYLFYKFILSVKYATEVEEVIEGATGTLHVPIFHFYDSLARLAVFLDSPKPERKRILKKVAKNQKKMKKWAHHAPMNHLHKFYLVEAERLRVIGKDSKAADLYDQAVELAKDNEYINEEALANELAGKFYLTKGKKILPEPISQKRVTATCAGVPRLR
ncbi:hypothetical protein QUF90_03340 [Desulfococcaceae bacterium HSG9]|nr:hypothetical protein [Desulfococcaceae bacterium HSG9]